MSFDGILRLEWSWDFYGAPCRFCYCTYDPSGKENPRTLILACQKTHHIIVESWNLMEKRSFELVSLTPWVEIRQLPVSKQVDLIILDHTWSIWPRLHYPFDYRQWHVVESEILSNWSYQQPDVIPCWTGGQAHCLVWPAWFWRRWKSAFDFIRPSNISIVQTQLKL